MTLLDANAFVALLRREPAGREVAQLLRQRECATPAQCLTEVVDRMIRRYGTDGVALSERLGALIGDSVAVIEIDARTAWQAGEIRASHYHRKSAPLSLADCLLLAAAGPEDEIVTSDRAIQATAREIGIGVISIPDSQGRFP